MSAQAQGSTPLVVVSVVLEPPVLPVSVPVSATLVLPGPPVVPVSVWTWPVVSLVPVVALVPVLVATVGSVLESVALPVCEPLPPVGSSLVAVGSTVVVGVVGLLPVLLPPVLPAELELLPSVESPQATTRMVRAARARRCEPGVFKVMLAG